MHVQKDVHMQYMSQNGKVLWERELKLKVQPLYI